MQPTYENMKPIDISKIFANDETVQDDDKESSQSVTTDMAMKMLKTDWKTLSQYAN